MILWSGALPAFTISISSKKSFFNAFLEPNTFNSFFWISVKLKSRFFLPTPMRTMRPPKQQASIQFWNVDGRPTASIVTSKPLPFVISATPFSKFSGESFNKVPSTPKSFAISSLPADTSEMYTVAPFAFAAIAARTPMVPAPTTRTLSPSFTFARLTPW